jgi:hypothetical protein
MGVATLRPFGRRTDSNDSVFALLPLDPAIILRQALTHMAPTRARFYEPSETLSAGPRRDNPARHVGMLGTLEWAGISGGKRRQCRLGLQLQAMCLDSPMSNLPRILISPVKGTCPYLAPTLTSCSSCLLHEPMVGALFSFPAFALCHTCSMRACYTPSLEQRITHATFVLAASQRGKPAVLCPQHLPN